MFSAFIIHTLDFILNVIDSLDESISIPEENKPSPVDVTKDNGERMP